MPDNLVILTFEFEGFAETTKQETSSQNSLNNNTDTIVAESSSNEILPHNILNKNADIIAQDIEKELAKLLFKSSTQVKAEVRFYEGSILIQGTVILLSWLGSTILTAGKSAIEEEITRLVKTVVQRVINKALQGFTDPLRNIQVVAHPPSPYENATIQQGNTTFSSYLPSLIVTNSILLVLIIILLILPYIAK